MQNIITAAQMQKVDAYTIQHRPIPSIDLMEKAALAFVGIFCGWMPDRNISILICCGTGNNGGDGLAIARLLQERCYDRVAVQIARFAYNGETADFTENLKRLRQTPVPVAEIREAGELGEVKAQVVIDALLGSGLNKPLAGQWQLLANLINQSGKKIVAVDVPTGLRSDGLMPPDYTTIRADKTISFQRPKLSFFFPESAASVKLFHVVDIGLDEGFLESLPADYYLVETSDIQQIYRNRQPFSHKGTYGHALLMAGDDTTMGAALLCSGACLFAGAGLTTACIPDSGRTALNTRYPEVMTASVEEMETDWKRWTAVALGPGLGNRRGGLKQLLEGKRTEPKPMVLDADALNYLGENPDLLGLLPPQTILTPHMKEFDRLFGKQESWWDRLQSARKEAIKRDIVIILKNQYTFIVQGNGKVFINATGNPAMASGGMGDVLTGMLVSFLAQGYAARDAAILGCYLHGRAGDLLAARGMAVVPAGILIEKLPQVLAELGARY